MDQVSRPFLIALIAVVGFAGVWMTVLRPQAQQAADEPAAAAPATSGLKGAVDQARGAVAASEESAKATEAATNDGAAQPAPAPVTPATAEPKAKPAAVDHPTVIALLGDGEDDALARELVRSLDVRTLIIPIDRIGEHADLLGAIEIRSTPTILVVGADHRAQRIEGLPDAAQLEQALAAIR